MLGVFWFIILAGLFGTKVPGRNAAPMIIWVLWLSALIILLVPIGGRIWCTACPLPLLGEWLQRLPPLPKSGGTGRQVAAPHLRHSASMARVAEQRMAASAVLPPVGDLQHDPGGGACRHELDVDRSRPHGRSHLRLQRAAALLPAPVPD